MIKIGTALFEATEELEKLSKLQDKIDELKK